MLLFPFCENWVTNDFQISYWNKIWFTCLCNIVIIWPGLDIDINLSIQFEEDTKCIDLIKKTKKIHYSQLKPLTAYHHDHSKIQCTAKYQYWENLILFSNLLLTFIMFMYVYFVIELKQQRAVQKQRMKKRLFIGKKIREPVVMVIA